MGQRPALVVIAAVARNGVIGNGNELPWRCPGQQFFKRPDDRPPVIMGRKTWESLPARFKPLPGTAQHSAHARCRIHRTGGRVHEPLRTRSRCWPVHRRSSSSAAPTIYAQALPLARELVLTEIDCDFAGRTVFPTWPRAEFAIVEQTDHDSDQGFGYRRVRYRRKTAD